MPLDFKCVLFSLHLHALVPSTSGKQGNFILLPNSAWRKLALGIQT